MSDGNHIESWTVEEVSSFLSTLNLEQYCDDFLENGITGDILIHLDHESLRDIGVESVGHRLAILRQVYNVKISDNVTIEPEHYVPATAELASSTAAFSRAEITQDLMTITKAIQTRDEKLAVAETEIKRLTENLARLKDQLIPVFKIVKEYQPLPTPDLVTPTSSSSQPSLSRKFSTKKLFLSSTPRQASPVSTPTGNMNDYPASPLSPSKYIDITPATSSSRQNTPVHTHALPPVQESHAYNSSSSLPTRLPPPPRPPPPGVTPLQVKRDLRNHDREGLPSAHSIISTAHTANHNHNGGSGSGNSSNNTSMSSSTSVNDQFKSFRVNLDDPCSKVLPAALKRYKIQSDWRDYSLFICYADQERCLGLEEKPLLVFQELQKANKSPVFMLRKHDTGTTSVMPVVRGTTSSGSVTNGLATGLNGKMGTGMKL